MRTALLAHHSSNGNGGNIHMNLETGFKSFPNEIDQVFGSFTQNLFNSFPIKTSWNNGSNASLNIDVADNADSIQVKAECPGMEQNDLDVSWTDGILTIKGEKKSFWDQESNKLYRSERVYGKFKRQISLPAEIEAEKVEASYKNGVLTVTLPKSQEAKTQVKKITINSD